MLAHSRRRSTLVAELIAGQKPHIGLQLNTGLCILGQIAALLVKQKEELRGRLLITK